MRRRWVLGILLFGILALGSGCKKQQEDTGSTKNQQNIKKEEIVEEEKEVSDHEIEMIDLTTLGSTMMNAELFNIVNRSEEYLGKKIRIRGVYTPMKGLGEGKYYHYIMVYDEAACCQNGIEFIWDDNQHGYPEEYPKAEHTIQLEGILKSYEQEGEDYYYLEVKGILSV